MKRFLFILCCIISLALTVFLTYKTWVNFQERVWYENLIYIVAIFGWCRITEKMINKKYKWIQKFFK